MKANLIKTLKNTAEVIEIEAGRSARANFPGVNFENAVLIINGKIADPDTIIQEYDTVTLRQIPGDLTDTPWWVSTFIIPFGFLIQPAELAYKARQEAEAAERELEKIKKLTNAPEIDNSPFLRGATNSIATGKSQPYFCGRNFLTPYLFSKPFYKISGTDGATQEVFNILECGFKGIVLNKLGIGDTLIKTFDETAPQNDVYTINEGIFANGQFEVRQNGAAFSTLTELNTKVVSNVVNREIVKDFQVTAGTDEHTIITLDPNAKNIEVCIQFPYGLYQYDSENERVAAAVAITPEYSLDGGSTWTTFTFNQNGTASNVFSRNTTKSMRFVAHADFTLLNYETLYNNNQNYIMVRISSNAPDDQKVRADCYLYYYQSQIFDPQKSSYPAGVLNDFGVAGLVDCLNVEDRERGFSCVAGLRLVATKNNEGKLTQINIIATSTARTWDGSAWSSGKSPTRNPAAIALEILTSDTHPASRYADAEIDLDAFGAFYEYCALNDLYFDDIITQGQKKDSELQKIADVCGVAFYKDIYGRRSVAIDQAQPNAVAVYTQQNIISLTNKKTFARRVDALRIKYIDSTNDVYKENTYTVTRLENGQPVTIDENSIIKDVNAAGITRQPQIVKYGRRLMAIDELRPITTTLKVGYEGVYFTPYSRIVIQDPSLNRDAQDCIIESCEYQFGLLKKIHLNTEVNFENPNIDYGIIINVPGTTRAYPVALKVTGTGKTKVLDVADTYSISEPEPTKGNIATFGELDENGKFTRVVHQFIITRIARTDGGFNLDLQEYNEAIYNTGAIPAYKPIVNNTPTPAAGTIPADSVTHEELDEAVSGVNDDAVQAAVDTIENGYRFTNIYNVRPVEDTLADIVARLDDDARQQSASISITEAEILLQVKDMERELVGLVDIQAGAVTALVEGGGARGEMSLSLNLPAMINNSKRLQLIAASSEAKVNAVYALAPGTTYYGIKGNASNAAVKALWDDAIAAGLLASQIILSADQINIAGKTIYTSGKTDRLADAVQSNAEAYANTVSATTAETKRNEMAQKLGYASYDAMVTAAQNGQTIIDGGYLRTALIEVENLLTRNIMVKDNGSLRSATYNGGIDQYGNIVSYGSAGWAIDHAGRSDFTDVHATRGIFKECHYEGTLNCGSLIVDNRSVEFNVVFYNNNDSQAFRNYLINHFGTSYQYDGSVAGLYGAYTYIYINGVRYANVRITIIYERTTVINVTAYNSASDEVVIYIYEGGAVVSEYFYYPYNITYYNGNQLCVIMNQLPPQDPHIYGCLYRSGLNIQVSLG